MSKRSARFDNVFALCTGRCGSTTFARSASHISNYSSGHETRTHLSGIQRFTYPNGHIEADNRLSWMLGRLDRHFGQDAFYVHLTRNTEAVAASFAKRADRGIMRAYRTEILMRAQKLNSSSMYDFALDYIDTVNENIRLFLQDKPNTMSVRLENSVEDFASFWEEIGAEGELDSALHEWTIAHNSS